ncbi:hypothetical protein B566_EDAN001476 [Ephemera danica]|nr:hypothetical protein B566_EDAN001476 [Ephemera danica]
MAKMETLSLQEVKAQPQNLLFDALFDDPWINCFRDALLAKDFVKARSIRLQGLLLSVFCKRKHLLRLRDVETQYTRTGLGGMWGNKGAVSVRLVVSGVSVCLVNCHFSAHDHMKSERIAEYNTVLQSHSYTARETSHILYHDYVFWLGDLNFRMTSGSTSGELSAEQIGSLISRGELTQLMEHDELRDVMRKGEAFSELSEPSFTFAPTYKFNTHSSMYDLKRRPAWTDRILYQVKPDVYENLTLEASNLSYQSWSSYVQSDHKPVSAEYSVKVFRDHHDRVVDFQPIAHWFVDEENIASFSFSSDVDPTSGNDWIGIYRENFSSLEDYVFYVYVPRAPTVTGYVHVAFPDAALTESGSYRLLYITQNFASVLGMSAPFSAIQRDSSLSQLQYRPRF